MIIRTPSAALRKRIAAAGEAGPLAVLSPRVIGAQWARVIRANGSELSEPEQRRVAGLVAADNAEPFT